MCYLSCKMYYCTSSLNYGYEYISLILWQRVFVVFLSPTMSNAVPHTGSRYLIVIISEIAVVFIHTILFEISSRLYLGTVVFCAK